MNPEQLEQFEQFNNSGDGSPIGAFVALLLLVVVIAAMWKVFVKAGEPGWAAIVPIYNAVILLKIAGKPLWWIILLLIPLVNVVIGILVALGLSERFGKGAGFGVGLALIPMIFYPILGFGNAQYSGPKSF